MTYFSLELAVLYYFFMLDLKYWIENLYQNCNVIVNNDNFGYGKAANIGLQKINSKYALILEADVKISEIQWESTEICEINENHRESTKILENLRHQRKSKRINENLQVYESRRESKTINED